MMRLMENLSSVPILIFILSLPLVAVISSYDKNTANQILIYTFGFLVLGVLWKLVIAAIEGAENEEYANSSEKDSDNIKP